MAQSYYNQRLGKESESIVTARLIAGNPNLLSSSLVFTLYISREQQYAEDRQNHQQHTANGVFFLKKTTYSGISQEIISGS